MDKNTWKGKRAKDGRVMYPATWGSGLARKGVPEEICDAIDGLWYSKDDWHYLGDSKGKQWFIAKMWDGNECEVVAAQVVWKSER